MTAVDSRVSDAAAPADQASRLRAAILSLPDRAEALPARAPGAGGPVLAITSGKGGVGKTSLAVNLAIALSKLGVRVVLVDADLGMANADVLCGLNPARRLELAIPVGGQRTALTALALNAPGGFRLVPGSTGIARMAAMSGAERDGVLHQIDELRADADLVILDTGAGLGPGVLDFVEAAQLALVVATPEPTSIADAYAMLKCLARRGVTASRGTRIGLVVNQALDQDEANRVHGRISSVSQRFLGAGVESIGSVRSDPAVAAAVRARVPLLLHAPGARAAGDVRSLSESVSRVLELRPSEETTGVIRRFLRVFSRPSRG